MCVREDHKLVVLCEVHDAVRKACGWDGSNGRCEVLTTGVGAAGIGPGEDVFDAGFNSVEQFRCEALAPFRVPGDGRVQLCGGLDVLAPAEVQTSRGASFARI